MSKANDILAILDAERDHWRKRENELSGTQDLYAIGEATGAQKALRRIRCNIELAVLNQDGTFKTDPEDLEQIRSNDKYLRGILRDFGIDPDNVQSTA